jgi:pimeloyl-ACP methyl ester carboxylesterase
VSVSEWALSSGYDSALGEIRWDRLGDPDAEPVVLVHGTPFSSFIWRDVARALAASRSVYVFDMPGYGSSAMSEGQDLSLDALAGVFTELLRHWGLHRPDVVAHDSGGAVALGAHVDRGVPYRRLALVDAVSLAPWGSEFFAVVGEHPEVFRRLPGTLHRALLREYVATASSPGLRPEVMDALTAPWLGADGQAAFYRQLAQRNADQSYTDRIQHRYASIDLPVLVCWGADDTWVPAERGRELAALVPGADLRLIDTAGHLLPEDRPGQLTAALLTFLENPAG